jgi:hypothetical protein
VNFFPRIAARHPFYGPMMLMVRTMVMNTINFLVLQLWIVLAWGFFFWVLFREPFSAPADAELAL